MTASWVVAACRKPAGAVGACDSAQAAVDTVAVAGREWFSERSKATTETSMLSPHASLVAVYLGTRHPGTQRIDVT